MAAVRLREVVNDERRQRYQSRRRSPRTGLGGDAVPDPIDLKRRPWGAEWLQHQPLLWRKLLVHRVKRLADSLKEFDVG